MFVWAFSKLGDLGSALGALKDMVALAAEGTVPDVLSDEGGHSLQRLDIPILLNDQISYSEKHNDCSGLPKIQENQVDELQLTPSYVQNTEDDIVTEVPGIKSSKELGTHHTNSLLFPFTGFALGNRVKKTLRQSFNNLIHACAKAKNCELAEQLFLQMHHLGLEPSANTYDGFVRAVIFEKGVTYGEKMVKAMQKRNLKPHDSTLASLSIAYSKILELDLAEALLDQISDFSLKSIYLFNSLLAAYYEVDKPELAVKLLARMKHLNIKPDIKTYELLFGLFGNVNAPYEEGSWLSQADVAKRVHAIETDMIRNDVQHNCFTLENLIRALGSEGMIEDLLRYLRMAENMFTDAYPGTITYNIVLHSLVEARESCTAIQIFSKMRSCLVPFDAGTYNIMIDWCSVVNHLKSAEALVSLMLRDGFFPAACTYSTLIKIVLENEDFDEALRLLDQSISLGIGVDVLMFNSILDKACFKGYLDAMELIIERMHREKVQPDPKTCSYVFCLYYDHGLQNTAMEALQVLSMRMISEEDSVLQEKKAAYESLVHSEDPSVESWIVDIFDKSNEYLGAALLNLRWCAIAGYSISWEPNESAWGKRLSSCYSSRKLTAKNA